MKLTNPNLGKLAHFGLSPFKLVLAIVATSAVMFTSGCASIPTDSNVKTGSAIKSVSSNDLVYFSPYEPPRGGSIDDILTGFLSAGTGPQNDYAVARMYLSNSLKTNWLPNEQVVVTESTPEIIVDSANNSAKVLVSVSALVDKGGRLSTEAAGAKTTYEYSFVKEDDQWRISSAPNLTLVSKPVFDVVFKSFSLYFFDAQRRFLVPDVRWFPSRASTATRLVNALIAGPDPWIAGAATNSVPTGTKLAIDAVTITDGVAAVNFNTKVLAASAMVRAQLHAQLLATLTQISGVQSVQILVDRNPQDFGAFSPWDLPILSLAPVVLTNNSLAHLSGSSTTPIDGTKTLVEQLKPKDFAITSQNNWVAATTNQGLYQASLLSLGAEPTLVDARTNLLAPVFDRQGWLWSVNDSRSPKIKLFDQTGHSAVLGTEVFAGKRVLSFALSPEGARLAAVVESGKARQVWIFGVVRNVNGLPTKLSGASRVSIKALSPVKVTWLDGSSLGILSKNTNGWSMPSEVTFGGFETDMTGLNDIENFIGSPSTSNRFVLTKNGDLLQFRGSTWNRVQSGILQVHYPN